MEQDLTSQITLVNAIRPDAYVADTTGAAVDTFGYESLTWGLHVGLAFAGGGFTISVESSPDDGAGSPTGVWTAIPAGELLDALPVISIGDTDKLFRIGIASFVRHQRLKLTETGTISAGAIGVFAMLGHPHSIPTDPQVT